MKPKRYLAIVQLQTAINIKNAEQVGRRVKASVESALTLPEPVLTTEKAFGWVGVATGSAEDVWKAMIPGLIQGDLVSVFELGTEISTLHVGLAAWHGKTRLFVE